MVDKCFINAGGHQNHLECVWSSLTQTTHLLSMMHAHRVFMGEMKTQGFPGGLVVKNPAYNAGGTGSIPSPVKSHMP